MSKATRWILSAIVAVNLLVFGGGRALAVSNWVSISSITQQRVDNLGATVVTTAGDTAIVVSSVTGTGTAALVPASALANRRTLTVSSIGANTQKCYLGPSSVTTGTGTEVSPGGNASMAIGPDVAIYAICVSGPQDLRTLETS